MLTYARKRDRRNPLASFTSEPQGAPVFGKRRDADRIQRLHRAVGNRAVRRLVEGNTGGPGSATMTRNPGGRRSDGETLTTNGTPSPTPTTPTPTPSTPPTTTPPTPTAPPADNCHVASGPTYTPSGTVPVTALGSGRKKATFNFAATFSTAASTGRVPRCCQVRQYIKWNAASQTWHSGPPHSGFPSTAVADTWYEDRDTNDKRYGHRSGTHSDPIANCGDEYKTGTTQDQANGATYCGADAPETSVAAGAVFQFQLKVIDTCNGNAEKASSSVITINW